jgi:hypothetical protein
MTSSGKPQRFDIGPDPDHPGFSEMHPAEGGRWVFFSEYEERVKEMERKEQIRESEVVEAQEHRSIHEGLRRKAEKRAEKAEAALRYITGEDVAGMEPHQRPEDVARAYFSLAGEVG